MYAVYYFHALTNIDIFRQRTLNLTNNLVDNATFQLKIRFEETSLSISTKKLSQGSLAFVSTFYLYVNPERKLGSIHVNEIEISRNIVEQ